MNINDKLNILLIPIDNRPVCYDFAIESVSVAKNINLLIPPKELMGSLDSYANTYGILCWLEKISSKIDYSVICLDTLAYGGLIASRRIEKTQDEIKKRIDKFLSILHQKNSKIYAFSSIMRISNNNINEEEKSYWSEYGKNIFDYSYNFHKNGKEPYHNIPQSILCDYLNTRKRNFEINKYYLSKNFDFLVFSRDDTSKYGLNVQEGIELQSVIDKNGYNAMVLSGADEIWSGLIARAYQDFYKESVSFFPVYNHPAASLIVTRYDGVSIDETFKSHLMMLNSKCSNNPDIFVIINAPFKIQDDLALNIFEDEEFSHIFDFDCSRNYMIADVRYANGSDNEFVLNNVFKEKADINKFFGYSGWNTTANAMGSGMATALIKYLAQKNNVFDEESFKKTEFIRFMDDWAYQANIRQLLRNGDKRDLADLFSSYVLKVSEFLQIVPSDISFYFPWNRTFEIGIVLK